MDDEPFSVMDVQTFHLAWMRTDAVLCCVDVGGTRVPLYLCTPTYGIGDFMISVNLVESHTYFWNYHGIAMHHETTGISQLSPGTELL